MFLTYYLLMVAKGAAKGDCTMEATVNRVASYVSNDQVRIRVTFNEEFDGITRNNAGEYVETKVNYVDFVPKYLIGVVIANIPGTDLMYARCKDEERQFGSMELQAVLRNAKMELTRTKFTAGEEYHTADGEVLQHSYDGYNTVIDDIEVSKEVASKLDKLMDKVFGL